MADTCPDCGKEYKRIRQHFAMSECGGDHSSKTELTCEYCGDTFREWTYRVEKGAGRFCSDTCRDRSRRNGAYVECDWCGGDTYKQQSFLENNDHFFCDLECEGRWRSERFTGGGHPMWNGGKVTVACSLEGCENTREVYPAVASADRDFYCSREHANEGNTVERTARPCAWCGAELSRRETEYKGEHAFCQDSDCFSKWMSSQRRGADNPAWKGGKGGVTAVRRMLGDRSWDAIARDLRADAGHVCQMCGRFQPHRKLSGHHIIPVASGGTHADELLMALCEVCHSKAENFINQYTEPHLLKYVKDRPTGGEKPVTR